MGGPPGSQVAPLPTNLPFRLVSKTIGSGAYASIRKAAPLHLPKPVIAVKFINKDHAFRSGRLRAKQLHIELSLHKSVCPHQNIIRYLDHGEDAAWVWMCMELADGGDLFDKIEADAGVEAAVAHFYFTQLVSAVAWCHGKGVAHRDIKPENVLLSGAGDLKLADFGLATQFLDVRSGRRKACAMVCGSPPYIAPEILEVGKTHQKRKATSTSAAKEEEGEGSVGYDPQGADVWSCAIVLFVLLVGNTPWDQPVMEESFEYHDYVASKGRPSDELWEGVPAESLSLIRGMLSVDPAERLTLDLVRKHPWFTQPNPHLDAKGGAANPVILATQMLESLKIDFNAPVESSQSQRARKAGQSQGSDAMDVDTNPDTLDPAWARLAATQPETPISDEPFDWEAPPRLGHSASQPTTYDLASQSSLHDRLMEDPSMSQFSQQPTVPLTLTQAARQFKDIVPSHSLARFISILPIRQLLAMLLSALHRLNIPVAEPSTAALEGREGTVSIRLKTLDARLQPLQGSLVVETVPMDGQGQVHEVKFVKAKGDPVGWRRLFKQVAVLCKEGVVVMPS